MTTLLVGIGCVGLAIFGAWQAGKARATYQRVEALLNKAAVLSYETMNIQRCTALLLQEIEAREARAAKPSGQDGEAVSES